MMLQPKHLYVINTVKECIYRRASTQIMCISSLDKCFGELGRCPSLLPNSSVGISPKYKSIVKRRRVIMDENNKPVSSELLSNWETSYGASFGGIFVRYAITTILRQIEGAYSYGHSATSSSSAGMILLIFLHARHF